MAMHMRLNILTLTKLSGQIDPYNGFSVNLQHARTSAMSKSNWFNSIALRYKPWNEIKFNSCVSEQQLGCYIE